ncbi:MAG: hypothetical protein KAU14_07770, partial [Thermoplasmata archaeon]|nr:hypothetical protein [Thermoplasmata archaeon]
MSRQKLAIPMLLICLVLTGIGGVLQSDNASAEGDDDYYWGIPDANEDAGYFIGATENGNGWSFLFHGDGEEYSINGSIEVSGRFTSIDRINIEKNDSFGIRDSGKVLTFNMSVKDREKGARLYFSRDTITFDLMVNGEHETDSVYLGKNRTHPEEIPFTINITHRYYLRIEDGDQQKNAPNRILPIPLKVSLMDECRNPVQHHEVRFVVQNPPDTKEKAKVDSPVKTDEHGNASAYFTFGDKAGTYDVTAKTTIDKEALYANFTLHAIEEPERIEIISGDNQHGVVNTTFQGPLVFRVFGDFGNPLKGIKMTAELISPDGGSISTPLTLNESNDRLSLFTGRDGYGEIILNAGSVPGKYAVKVYPEIRHEIVVEFHEYADYDMDGDGIPDDRDKDVDGDGFENDNDAFPRDPEEWADLDNDGIGDNADLDNDNDGLPDKDEGLIYQSDPWRKSFYEGSPIVFEIGTRPPRPTSIDPNIELLAHVASPYFPERDSN